MPKTVGEQLKSARERLGMALSDLAAKTRVPMRHLESIETSDFGALPGQTYTVGFVRSYARAVDVDEIAMVDALRVELSRSGHQGYQAPLQNYEPTDPARVPSRTLAWTAAAIAVLVLGAYLVFRNLTFAQTVPETQSVVQKTPTSVNAASSNSAANAANEANNDAPVVLTATDNVWVKIYDADQKRLFEKEMVAGDRFAVPQDANQPMIVTGRPQALTVTVDGKTVAPLGAPETTIADVGISAKDLLARNSVNSASNP